MHINVHNQLEIDFDKTFKTVSYFADSKLKQAADRDDWVLDVWLREHRHNIEDSLVCGIALKKPHESAMFVKKTGEDLGETVKSAFCSLNEMLR